MTGGKYLYKCNVPTTWQVRTSDKCLLNMPAVRRRLSKYDRAPSRAFLRNRLVTAGGLRRTRRGHDIVIRRTRRGHDIVVKLLVRICVI